MILNNTKFNKKTSGFTIVELLVVIVVIGILAAITIVSYTGVTARADGTKAQTNAVSVKKVAEIYAVDTANTGFPADATAITGYTTGMAKVPSGVTVVAAAQNTPTNATGKTTVSYMKNTASTGGCIGWWDYGDAVPKIKYMYVGAAASADFTIATPTCT